MKLTQFFGVLLAVSALRAQTMSQPQTATLTQPTPTPYAVVSRDANSALWQRTSYGKAPDGTIITNLHQYTELATGLNFKNPQTGQWQPSSEIIAISVDGTSASAINGQHQAFFPGDISSGNIKLVTPDGQVMQSQPVGLAYFDGTNSVVFALVTNSTGAILPPGNLVIYTNAFAGLNADLLYKYTKAGFEQDVVLREQPPDPSTLGLNSAQTRLQVLTEFVSAPQPTVTAVTVPTDAGNLENDNLNFGTMRMVRGKAFLLGTNSPSVSVEKRWLTLSGRQFLIEETPIVSLATAIDDLPPFVSQAGTGVKPVISKNLILPPQRLVKTSPGKQSMRVAKIQAATSGLVLDYQEISGLDSDDFTFQSGTTYYVSDTFSPQANLYLQGGVVIKYAPSESYGIAVDLCGTLICQTDPFHPAIFTEKDDNSVGETISGSTGTPVVSSAEALAFDVNNPPNNIENAIFRYCSIGVGYEDGPVGLVGNCQFFIAPLRSEMLPAGPCLWRTACSTTSIRRCFQALVPV
jgi:hypothetical protein